VAGTTRGWGLLVGLALVTVALFAAYNGVLSVLLPQQVAGIDPDNKVSSLAMITSISFAATALAQPLFGALSDRTRSRWGRRIPWMVAGAVVGSAALVAMGGVQSIVLLVVLWAVAQFALNGTDIASSVYLVDAFPTERRGRVAGIFGISAIAGGALGAVVAGMLGSSITQGYVLFAAAVLLGVALFVVVFREKQPAPHEAPEPFALGAFLRAFWVSPRRHPDFTWVLVWRVLFTVAYGIVQSFLFYLLTDHVGVTAAAAPGIIGLVTVVGGVGVVVAVLIGGWLSDALGRRKPFLIAACALVAIVDVVVFIAPTVPGIFALGGALGVGFGLAVACGTALASDVLPDPARGAARGLGVFNLGTNVGQAVAPLLAAAVIASLGGYPALFVASALIMLVAAATVFAIRGQR